MRGKSGKILMIYWFIMVVIIVGGIVGGVLYTYGKGFDIREAEADILKVQIIDCLVDKGVYSGLNADVFIEDCNLDLNDKSSLYAGEDSQYGIIISTANIGNENFEVLFSENENLFIESKIKSKNSPVYVVDYVFVKDKESEENKILKVEAVVDKNEKNI